MRPRGKQPSGADKRDNAEKVFLPSVVNFFLKTKSHPLRLSAWACRAGAEGTKVS